MGKTPATRQDLLARLAALDIAATTVEHPPLFTVEDSQKLRGEIPGAHSKNLFLKCKKGTLWLVVALEDARIDLKRFHARIGSGRLSFGKAELLQETLGVTPGSVTPFALINDTQKKVRVVLDKGLMAHDTVNFHPLENTATTSISPQGLLAFIRDCGHEPTIIDIGAGADGTGS